MLKSPFWQSQLTQASGKAVNDARQTEGVLREINKIAGTLRVTLDRAIAANETAEQENAAAEKNQTNQPTQAAKPENAAAEQNHANQPT